jgi:hypothetical protein
LSSFFTKSDYSAEALLGIPPEKTLFARLIDVVEYQKKVTYKESKKFGQIETYERMLIQCYYKDKAYMVETGDLGVNMAAPNSGMNKFLTGAFGTKIPFETIVKLYFDGRAENMVYLLNDAGRCAAFTVKIKHKANKEGVVQWAGIDGFGIADEDEVANLPDVDASIFYDMREKYKMVKQPNGVLFMPEFKKAEETKEADTSDTPM